MGRVKSRTLKSENEKESSIARALKGLMPDMYPTQTVSDRSSPPPPMIIATLKKSQAAEEKKVRQAAGQPDPSRSTKAKKVTIQSPLVIGESDNELEAWDADSRSSSASASALCIITISTPTLPLRRGFTPRTPPSPLTAPSRRIFIHIPSTPSTPLSCT